MDLVGQQELDVAPLDAVAAEEGLKPDCVKIDVQGAELDVLQGGAATIRHAKLVELEVEFNPQYRGQPLFADIDTYMREQGFALLGLRRTLWRRRAAIEQRTSTAGGQLVHGDVLYYNERAAGEDDGAGELVKWLLALSAYRQHDFVIQLLNDHPAAIHLDRVTHRHLRDALVTGPGFFLRAVATVVAPFGRLEHRIGRQMLDGLRLAPAEDWHDPDFF
jgi:hypothetical protein